MLHLLCCVQCFCKRSIPFIIGAMLQVHSTCPPAQDQGLLNSRRCAVAAHTWSVNAVGVACRDAGGADSSGGGEHRGVRAIRVPVRSAGVPSRPPRPDLAAPATQRADRMHRWRCGRRAVFPPRALALPLAADCGRSCRGPNPSILGVRNLSKIHTHPLTTLSPCTPQ